MTVTWRSQKKNIESLKLSLVKYPQLAGLLNPVIEYLNKAVDEYGQGYVLQGGVRIQKVEVKPQFKPHKGKSIEIGGVKYDDVEVSKVSHDSISLMHSKGISTIPKSTVNGALLHTLEEYWPKPFADFVAFARKEAELADIRKIEQEKRQFEMQNAINQQRETKDQLLARLGKIYGSDDEDELLRKARLLAGIPGDQPTMLSDMPLLAAKANKQIDDAEDLAETSGDSVADVLDKMLIVTTRLAQALTQKNAGARPAKRPLTAEEKEALEARRVPIAIQVSQALPEGALCYGRRVERIENAGGWVGLQRAPQFQLSEEHDQPIFVVGLPKTAVDGDTFMGWLYPCGTYNYTTVLGAFKRVLKYATSVDHAAQELE